MFEYIFADSSDIMMIYLIAGADIRFDTANGVSGKFSNVFK